MKKLNMVDLWNVPVVYAKAVADLMRFDLEKALKDGTPAAELTSLLYQLKEIEELIEAAEGEAK